MKNPEDPVQLEPRTPGLQVKHSTTKRQGTPLVHNLSVYISEEVIFLDNPYIKESLNLPVLHIISFIASANTVLSCSFSPTGSSSIVMSKSSGKNFSSEWIKFLYKSLMSSFSISEIRRIFQEGLWALSLEQTSTATAVFPTPLMPQSITPANEIERRMNGERWMDGWMNGWMDGWICRQLEQ